MAKRPVALGIIPARGGSKSVPRKNLHPLLGKPLIAWSILSALRATSLDRMIVSTDDAEIAEVAKRYGAEVPFLRPAEISADETPDLPVFQHALRALREAEGYAPDAIVHLRPTQPLRTPEQIDQAVELWTTSGADCVKSVRLVGEHPFKMYRLEGDRLAPYLDTDERRRRGPDVPRQSLEPVYLSAGVVDVIRRATVEAGSTEGQIVVPYFVNPSRYVNLDSPRDFEIAEALMRSLGWEEAEA
ncbi:MAG: acylneuraminate cytidylyltransferase family protein [Candidatus Rokuibacteriota bacterium]